MLLIALCAFQMQAGRCQERADAHIEKIFSKYAVEEVRAPTPRRRLVFHSREVRRFRTVIEQGSRGAPNFAGHYCIVTWGCGTDCRSFAIVDLLSGDVFTTSEIGTVTGVMGNDDARLDFRAASQALVISGVLNEDPASEAKHVFRWNGRRLLRVERESLVKTEF